MKAIFLLSIFCAASAWVTYLPKDIDNKPPWCEFCINLAKKLKEALLKGGEELKEVAHEFCEEKTPSTLVDNCNVTVDTYWEKVLESLKASFSKLQESKTKDNANFIKICIDIC